MNAVTKFDPSEARLPATYEAARTAIAECERIDEVKGWADKAAALASYARQANDDSLRVMAVRIQDRAMRRAGELLKLIPPANGANQNIQDGTVLKVTRTAAATDAGLSERQHKTAIRVASIPVAVFDAQVESARPPTVTQLAEQGKASRDWARQISPWAAIECPETREACETLERFATYCRGVEAASICRAINATEAAALSDLISVTRGWLDRIAACLAADSD